MSERFSRPAMPLATGKPLLLASVLLYGVGALSPLQAATTRVNVDASGTAALALDSEQVGINANGRFVTYSSEAANLVPGDTNGRPDIFLHDTLTGDTLRVSVSSSGSQSTGISRFPAISKNGQYIAYNSSAPDLVDADTNGEFDIFLYDRRTRETSRVSVDSLGNQALNGDSFTPALSADGAVIAFHSSATNLVSNDSNGLRDVFVHDRRTGITQRVNVSSSGAEATGGDSRAASISDDGRYVAFQSQADNLVEGDTNLTFDVFVRDLERGLTRIVSVNSQGEPSERGSSRFPALSGDGRFVAYQSSSATLVPNDTNGVVDIFVTELASGETTRVSVDSNGSQASGGDSSSASISTDGRLVVFSSAASNLVDNDSNDTTDIFLHDRESGETVRISTGIAGSQSTGGDSLRPALSGSGRFVVYESDAFNLVANDTNRARDIFYHDRGLAIDADADGVPAYRDADSDNDGIRDEDEAGADPTAPLDSDGDGVPDLADIDSDNDGITDLWETQGSDDDDDGRIDDFVDADGNGVDDGVDAVPTVLTDTDQDGLFDHLDTDSDGDGTGDAVESGFDDRNGDGVIDGFIDDDQDGRHDFPATVNDASRPANPASPERPASSSGGAGAWSPGVVLSLLLWAPAVRNHRSRTLAG